jgi:hypothetical protein
MPNADSSEITRLKRLKGLVNDSKFVGSSKFRSTLPYGTLPVPILFSLTNFLPGTGTHSIAAAQQVSAARQRSLP